MSVMLSTCASSPLTYNENPLPALETVEAFHAEYASGEETGKRGCKIVSKEVDGKSFADLILLVPP